MANPARKIEYGDVYQDTGTVLEAKGSRFIIEGASDVYEAARAVSCLIEPEAGDLVLVCISQGSGVYVLAVLERQEGARATLVADGDLEVKLHKGRFTVAAQEGVDLVSGKDVSVVSGGLHVNAVEGDVVLQRLSFLGKLAQVEVATLKVFAGTFDSVLDRLSQKVKRSYRVIEEIDQLKAKVIDYAAREHVSVRSKNVLMTAEELVKVDGDQIHLG